MNKKTMNIVLQVQRSVLANPEMKDNMAREQKVTEEFSGENKTMDR